ncbi:MAG: PIG-L deacetylase family protein [Anaerolineaceae bacterium]
MNVLVLAAHGDDMEFFAGGTIAKLCMLGHKVRLVLATDNTKGTFELTRDEMFAVRLSEPEAAGRVLGLAGVECLDYPDGELADVPLNVLRGQFMERIRRYQPEIVFTFDPWALYENHQDHRSVAWAAMEAASFSHFPLYHPEQVSAERPPWLVQQVYYFAKTPGETNRAVDISGEPIRRKVAALWEHTNQMVLTVAETQATIAAAPYDVPAISSLDPHNYRNFIEQRVKAAAAAVGKKYGFEHAEHFRRTRWGGTERMADGPVPGEEW